MKGIHLKKYEISLFHFLQILIAKLDKDNVMEMSRSMAYSFVLSIFPAIIFLFTLIPYIPIEHLDTLILQNLGQVLPRGIYEVAESTIYDIVARPQTGLLSFGFLFTLYASVNGIVAMINVFNKCYKTNDNRSFVRLIAISVQILFLLFFCVVSSIALQVVVEMVFSEIGFYEQGQIIFLSIIRYLLPYLLFLMCFSLIYSLAPAITHPWKFFSLGSLIAAFLAVSFSIVFILYFNNFSSYNKVYGSIGALIGLMLWIYFMSLIVLLGFEINATLEIVYKGRKSNNPD
ncbi:MAG: YihY/virulence factor BrkB family protein [Cytophagaceae bacterium]|nr:YihY/virulence factor BrkB family protein [Cytophagaceae bacterium]